MNKVLTGLALIIFFTNQAICSNTSYEECYSHNQPVRILIAKHETSHGSWQIVSKGGFMVYDPECASEEYFDESILDITFNQGAYCNGRPIQFPLYVAPRSGLLSINERSYKGIFSIELYENLIYLVNHLDLEIYIEAVLHAESVLDWPDEVQKVLCIAARTYAVKTLLDRRKESSLPYDLKSTILDQVYRGHSDSEVSFDHIIQETEGLILVQQNEPILAMYSAVCGGVTPADIHKRIFKKAPYLKRPYPCTHCTEQKYYVWQATISFDEIEDSLKELFPTLCTITNITIQGYDQAGLAQQILIHTQDGIYTMEAHNFRLRLYQIRSLCCTFETNDRMLYAQGRGYGHHIGLCQWGAYYMVTKGYTYQEILEYYYPNTELTTITL